MKNSFVLYTENIEQMEMLTMEQRGILFTALMYYVADRDLPQMDDVTEMLFSFLRISIDKEMEKRRDGKYHWNWKGGITTKNRIDRNCTRYKEFRNEVLKRDKFTCQKCGTIGGKLNVHHIKKFSEYEELRFDPSNGVTLCQKCHKEVHKNER